MSNTNVLVILEHVDGSIKGASLSGLTFGRELANATGGEVSLLVLGDDASAAATAAQAYGPVIHASDASLQPYRAEGWAPAIVAAAQQISARAVVATATSTAKDCLPRVAAMLDCGMASDALALIGASAEGIKLKRPMWAGNVISAVELLGTTGVVTVRGTEFEAATPAAGPGEISNLAYGASPESTRTQHAGYMVASGSGRPDPTEARVVVAGGRGFKAQEHFSLLENLADALGAGVGASRAACDAGWVPNDWQIGQTGKVVAPELYFAIGISGAIQHLAGMKGSKTIVAINKDPDAPIFQVSDYGLVADLFQVVPELIGSIK